MKDCGMLPERREPIVGSVRGPVPQGYLEVNFVTY